MKRPMKRPMKRLNLPGTLFLAALLALWQALAWRAASPNLPGIGAVLTALWQDAPDLDRQAGFTLWRALAGLGDRQ